MVLTLPVEVNEWSRESEWPDEYDNFPLRACISPLRDDISLFLSSNSFCVRSLVVCMWNWRSCSFCYEEHISL